MSRHRALFRQEAIDFHQHRQRWGDVASLQPLSTKIATWFVAIVMVTLIGFLLIAQYARKETAVGYLTPTKGTAKVFVPRRGAIREVHVDEGEAVVEGQPLLTVDTDQIASDGSDVNAALLDTLSAQKELLARKSSRRSNAPGPNGSVCRRSSGVSNPKLLSCSLRSPSRMIASSFWTANCRQRSS
jgi:membrane fusion protein